VAEGVERVDWLWYGPAKANLVHKITPTPHYAAQRKSPTKFMVYIHGGGFVFANSTVLLNSVTCFARQGFTVYSIDYPLAPENKFPIPQLAVLQALHWMREDQQVTSLVALGDSAGGSLVSMAAAFIMNPELMQSFAKACDQPDIVTWSYPKIESMALMYGLLDQTSWRGRHLKQISEFENYLAEGGVSASMELYKTNVFDGRITLADVLDDVKAFPRTLLIGGSQDPLVYSTLVIHEKLVKLGHAAHCKIYPGRWVGGLD